MKQPSVIFCGSFLEHSAVILERLQQSQQLNIRGVITTPAQASGRSNELVPTPVEIMARQLQLPVATPETLDENSLAEISSSLGVPDVLLTAGYGKLLPESWLLYPRLAAVNLHFSLLPSYRGANPAEWALLCHETQTGVTLIEMSPSFDTGLIIAQSPSPITEMDTRETIYQALYELGATVLPTMIARYLSFKWPAEQFESATEPAQHQAITYFFPPIPQAASPTPYAKRLRRDDGFINWSAVKDVMAGAEADIEDLSPQLAAIAREVKLTIDAQLVERAIRALASFPGVWTMVETSKGLRRLKLHRAHLEEEKLVLDQVQLEGQAVSDWEKVKSALT